MHTGDFKVDYTPVFGDAIDLQRFAEIGKKGVLALMSDSTNAERPGFTQSERTVGITFDHILQNIRIRESSLRLSRQMWIVYSRLSTLHANMTERL